MRFATTDTVNVENLRLDEENPRLGRADSQRECIEKIYNKNPSAFREMIDSLSSHDLSEPLLVSANEDGSAYIAKDGNRRLAALKVLNNPTLGPTQNIRARAEELRRDTSVDFDYIQVQIADKGDLLDLTLSERHGGGGAGRIRWSARASARFRLRSGQGHDSDWRASVLLEDAEGIDGEVEAITESKAFSFDSFRRIVRTALELGLIEKKIFADGSQSLDQRCSEETIRQTRSFVRWAINRIADKTITLSGNRGAGQVYADGAELNEFLSETFGLPKPDLGEDASAERDESDSFEEKRGTEKDPRKKKAAKKTMKKSRAKKTFPHRVEESRRVTNALVSGDKARLSRLYRSITTVAATVHAELMYIACWTFFEILLRSQPKQDPNVVNPDNILGSLNQLASEYSKLPEGSHNSARDLHNALRHIHTAANRNKHNERAGVVNAPQLIEDMRLLSDFTAWLSERA